MTTAPPSPARARFGALLKQHRIDATLTQLAVGRRFKVTKDAVGKWEKGRSLPAEQVARELDQILHADGAIYRAWREADSEGDQATASPIRLSAASLLASSAQDAAAFGTWAELANTGAVAITAMTNRVRTLSDLALTVPPADLVTEAADISRTLFGLLRGHNKPAHTRDLCTATGACNALLAWLAGDLGQLDAARVHGATAQICADMSENPELVAVAAAVRSKTAFWAGDYVAAANIACAGAAAAYDAPGTMLVLLACQQADAWAKLAAADETAAALDRARAAADNVRGPDSLGGLFSCKPGRSLNYAATCNNEISRHAASLAAADAALAEFELDPEYGFGTVAQTHLTRMLAYANAGDLDAAAVAARPVLDLPQERRLSTLTGRLWPLARALAAPSMATSRVAGPLREEITAFCRDSGQLALTAGVRAS
jgi:transcriptional regulator with XRE-family HTH domain